MRKVKSFLRDRIPYSVLSPHSISELAKEQAEQSEEVISEYTNSFRPETPTIDTDKYQLIRDYLKAVSLGVIDAFMITSRAGLGKTRITLETLKSEGIQFYYVSGYTTPLELYKTLYRHKDELIVFDDIEGLFCDKVSVAILKSALFGVTSGKRVVSYLTSKNLFDVPKAFEFTGKIVILANQVSGNRNENFRALMSRLPHYVLRFSFDEIIEISNKIIQSSDLSDTAKQVAFDYVNNEVKESDFFNFRELNRLIAFLRYDSEKGLEMYKASRNIDDELKIVCELVNSGLSVDDQIKSFNEQTGKSRRTYFRLKKRLREHY